MAAFAVLALLFSAFAHDPLAPPPWSEAIEQAHYAAEYMLPDGTVPERCHDFADDHGEHRLGGCESCRIASFSWMPDFGVAEALIYSETANAVWPPVETQPLLRACYRLNGPSRAPPFVLV
ncbi:MAG: hypothetical protein AAF940_08770 [Pseudomonadota bacterium]